MDKRLPGRHCREPMTAALVLMTATVLSRVRTSCQRHQRALRLKGGRHGYRIVLVGYPRIAGFSRH